VGNALYLWFLATVTCGSPPHEQEAAVDEMIAIARAHSDGELEIKAQWAAAHISLERLDRDGFDQAVTCICELAERLRQGTFRWMAAALVATQAQLDGDLAEADRLAAEALVIGQQADEPTAYEACGVQLTVTVTWRDDIRLLGHMYGMLGRLYPTFSMNTAWPLAQAMLESRPDDLKPLVEALRVDDVSKDATYLVTIGMLSFVVAIDGNQARARELLACWEPYRDLAGLPTGPAAIMYSGPLSRGLLHIALGEHDAAIAALEQAVVGFERLRSPCLITWAQIELARAHLLRAHDRDRDQATRLLEQAEDVGQRLGLTYMLRRVAEVRVDPTQPDSWGTAATPAARRATLRVRAERAIGMLVSGQVGRWVRDRDDADIERRFGSARVQRTIFNAMARSVEADNAGDIVGDLVFELSRVSGTAAFPEPDVWTVELRSGEGKSRQGGSANPLLVLKLGIPDFVRILGGELGAWEALVNRRMRMEGDMMVAMRMEAIFGGALELAGPDIDQ
ncbi:MAG: SCP2 sterol-binding domain-containing protein, partial [Acidimicrobiales bacterium]